MKLVAFALFGCLLSAQTKIVGTFHYPDAVTVTGKATISLPRVGVTNKCASPVQVVRFPPVTIKIAAGTLASLALYATSCLTPGDPYIVRVYDNANQLLYSTRWTVPNQAEADVTVLEPRQQ